MLKDGKIFLGMSGEEKIFFELSMANRHGFIAGATGTGKTTTLRNLAQSFSDAGVPVFLSDMKGDVASMSQPGVKDGFVAQRIEEYGLEAEGFTMHGCPCSYWDVYEEKGMPLRTTVSEMGPLLLSKILGLTDIQEAVLTVIFKAADDEGLLLIDTKDLKAMLAHASENAKDYSLKYGNMSSQSIAAIVRAVVALEAQGGERFFGEPALNIVDWIRTNAEGKGYINILDCQKLSANPTMYGTFMLWMLSELYENLPEVGDMDKPRIVFFFDEAHLLFNDASKELQSKIEQVVKLIRSKGVGIFFITQSPKDVPEGVLAQLSNKIQHALHAYTPLEQKAVKAAAESFRENPEFDTFETLQNLAIGEAIVSTLDQSGVPTVAKKCVILPPECASGPLDDGTRQMLINQDNMFLKYKDFVDRDSAYEFLERKGIEASAAAEEAKAQELAEKQAAKEEAAAQKAAEKEAAAAQKAAEKEAAAAQKAAEKEAAAAQKAAEKEAAATKNATKKVAKSVASTTGGTIGRELGKAVGNSIGGTFGKTLGGNIGSSLGRGILGSLFGK